MEEPTILSRKFYGEVQFDTRLRLMEKRSTYASSWLKEKLQGGH